MVFCVFYIQHPKPHALDYEVYIDIEKVTILNYINWGGQFVHRAWFLVEDIYTIKA